MKRTKKNEKAAVKNFIETKNFTNFCKSMQAMGIVKRSEMHELFYAHYSKRYLTSKKVNVYNIIYNGLKCDLNTKKEHTAYVAPSFVDDMKKEKEFGRYKKVLIEGNKHIYWASPVYGLSDYNKSIWRENTPENRRKMQIINAYLNK